MKLINVVLAIGIAVFMSMFFSTTIGHLYKAPTVDFTSCTYPSTFECQRVITDICGSSPGFGDDSFSTYTQCSSNARSSEEYRSCTDGLQDEYEQCRASQNQGLVNYQISSFLIYALISMISVGIGVMLFRFETTASGLMMGGGLLIIFGGTLSFFSSISSSILSITRGGTDALNTLKILQIIIYLIFLIGLLIISFVKVDLKNSSSENRKKHSSVYHHSD